MTLSAVQKNSLALPSLFLSSILLAGLLSPQFALANNEHPEIVVVPITSNSQILSGAKSDHVEIILASASTKKASDFQHRSSRIYYPVNSTIIGTPIQTEATSCTPIFTQRLEYGKVNENTLGQVSALQSYLASIGYDAGPIDGIFKHKTEGGIRAFQRDMGITIDGIVGPVTQSKLNTTFCSIVRLKVFTNTVLSSSTINKTSDAYQVIKVLDTKFEALSTLKRKITVAPHIKETVVPVVVVNGEDTDNDTNDTDTENANNDTERKRYLDRLFNRLFE